MPGVASSGLPKALKVLGALLEGPDTEAEERPVGLGQRSPSRDRDVHTMASLGKNSSVCRTNRIQCLEKILWIGRHEGTHVDHYHHSGAQALGEADAACDGVVALEGRRFRRVLEAKENYGALGSQVPGQAIAVPLVLGEERGADLRGLKQQSGRRFNIHTESLLLHLLVFDIVAHSVAQAKQTFAELTGQSRAAAWHLVSCLDRLKSFQRFCLIDVHLRLVTQNLDRKSRSGYPIEDHNLGEHSHGHRQRLKLVCRHDHAGMANVCSMSEPNSISHQLMMGLHDPHLLEFFKYLPSVFYILLSLRLLDAKAASRTIAELVTADQADRHFNYP